MRLQGCELYYFSSGENNICDRVRRVSRIDFTAEEKLDVMLELCLFITSSNSQ